MERILIIADNLLPCGPHWEASVVAQTLQRAGATIHIVDLGRESIDSDTDRPDRDERTRLPWPRRFCSTTRSRLASLGREFRPNQIHCWGPRSVTAGLVANRCGARLTAVHASVQQTLSDSANWKRRLEMARVDHHLVRSIEATSRLSEKRPRWKISCLPWSRPEPVARNPQAIRKTLGIPENAKLAGTLAPMIPETRIKDFIWAGDLMSCIRDDVYWLVIGDGPHCWRLNRFARHLEVGQHLRMPGWLTEASAAIAALDVYVEPSSCFESSSGLIHAITHGVPAVATTSDLHRQLVRHGTSGFTVERGARNEIGRCVNRLVNQPSIAAGFSRQSAAVAGEVLVEAEALVRQLTGSTEESGPGPSPLAVSA